MCYRCQVCERTSPPGHPRLVHRLFREIHQGFTFDRRPVVRREIARELSVCLKCHRRLERGDTVEQLRRRSALARLADGDEDCAPIPRKATPKTLFGVPLSK